MNFLGPLTVVRFAHCYQRKNGASLSISTLFLKFVCSRVVYVAAAYVIRSRLVWNDEARGLPSPTHDPVQT